MAEALGPGMSTDMLKEQWLRYFCSDEERQQLLHWLKSEGLCRPLGFDERLEHAAHLRELGNDWFRRSDYRRALHCALGALHTLDWRPAEQLSFSEEQRRQSGEAILPVISNFAMILLKRGDFSNAENAATVGLRCAHKLPRETTVAFRVKLLYRRGLARGEPGPSRDLAKAREDLADAAKLEPGNREIRACLERCKELLRQEQAGGGGAVAAEADSPAAAAEAQRGGPEAAKAEPRSEPSALTLRLAEGLGRCLGRSRRRSRQALPCARRANAALCRNPARAGVAVVVLVGPLLAICVASGLDRWRSADGRGPDLG